MEREPSVSPEEGRPSTAATPESQPRQLARRQVPRSVSVPLLSVLGVFVVYQGHGLWREWQSFRQEFQTSESTSFIGYHNVYPRFSTAKHPKDWFRSEGDSIFLWSGWEGKRHLWFKAKKGELEQSHLSDPIGRDVFRGIEVPWIETGGGSIWDRVPSSALVVGESLEGSFSAYPLVVLQHVCLVHDKVKDHPFLVIRAPTLEGDQSICVCDTQSAGPSFHLGTSGYLLDGKVLLYDRETESLWVEEGESLSAISGPHKGMKLPLIDRPAAVAWGKWKTSHPGSRLVVGSKDPESVPASH